MTQKSDSGRRRKGVTSTILDPMNSMLPTAGSQAAEIMQVLLEGQTPGYDRIMSIIDEAVAAKPHHSHGFVRIGTGSPEIEVADPMFNAKSIVRMMKKAQGKKVNILLLPELAVTGYTCADLFFQEPLRRAAVNALEPIRLATRTVYKGVVAVGCPIELDGDLYNCAVLMQGGKYLGVVPKSYLPTYGEFDESRWFKHGRKIKNRSIILNGQEVRMGVDLLFQAVDFPGLIFGVEICEDGWAVIPPHRFQALGGALVFLNLSASNELAGKDDYRREHLLKPHSSQSMGCYAYASTGAGESTTDMVPGGHCLIAENGGIVKEVEPFAETEPFCYADIDIDHLLFERMRNNTFREQQDEFDALIKYTRVGFVANAVAPKDLTRFVDAYPFVPRDPVTRDKRCKLITEIQVRGLKKRLKKIAKKWGGIKKYAEWLVANGKPLCVLGVSGGLDSTHALNIVIKTLDELEVPRSLLHGYTMPGFGTTSRTYDNAWKLMKLTGITAKEVNIRARCLIAWIEEGYKPFGIDLDELRTRCQGIVKEKFAGGEETDLMTVMLEEFGKLLTELPPDRRKDLVFENKQARARTDILMNAGFVIGTGDLSELAVGWCTYNGDHMAMYGVNSGIPKTLVHFLVKWAAEYWFKGDLGTVLIDVAETEVSPELLPPGKDGKIAQKTNSSIGPADLRDFFLAQQRRWASSPEKIVYLATFAEFNTPYSEKEIRHWLKVYIVRFFENRFKHSCLPDGPKVGSVSFSPRYDWHMPSDASDAIWLTWVIEEDSKPLS